MVQSDTDSTVTTTAEVAEVILFLASSRASAVTGVTYPG